MGKGHKWCMPLQVIQNLGGHLPETPEELPRQILHSPAETAGVRRVSPAEVGNRHPAGPLQKVGRGVELPEGWQSWPLTPYTLLRVFPT